MRSSVEAAEAKAKDAAEQEAFVRQACDEKLRVAQIEGQGMVKLLTAKWRSEFDKRKKLHNQV